jgi:hypothetical protein
LEPKDLFNPRIFVCKAGRFVENVVKKVRERQTDRQRERDRERQRETERDRERQTGRQRERLGYVWSVLIIIGYV